MGKLFEKQLRSLLGKPREKKQVLQDGDGLGARLTPSGKIRWQFRYKINGKNKSFDYGYYPDISLQRARELCRESRSHFAEGRDPKSQWELGRTKTLEPVTVQDALEYWLVEYAEHKRANALKHRQQFARHIYPYIGNLPLEQTETRHWLECFDRIRKGYDGKRKPAPVAAGYVFQNAKQALRFCRARHYAESRALDDLIITDVGSKQNKGERVLTDKELISLLEAIQPESKPFCLPYYLKLIKLLLVFGSRTQEVRLSTWDEWDFDEGLWTVPTSHSKCRNKIIRPIPPALQPWLLELKAANTKNNYVLAELKKDATVSVFGGSVWERLGHKEKWTLHDIRRTVDTKMNDYGLAQPYVIEQLLGHVPSGVMAIYNRSQYLPEKREALDKWVEKLESLVYRSENILLFSKVKNG